MSKLPFSLLRIINEFSKLPGIGQKSAQRLAFYLLKREDVDNNLFADSILNLKKNIFICEVCKNMAEKNLCDICRESSRDKTVICVVEEPLDVVAIERSGEYKGVYHVLGGVLNPLEGIGPEKLYIDSLISRLGREDDPLATKRGSSSQVNEIIIATNPSLEGETTAMYLSKILKQKAPEIKITRIARGLPTGGDLEYTDDVTLMRAMEGRREY